MKRCLKAQSSASTLNDVVAGIASTLGCDDNEVTKLPCLHDYSVVGKHPS